MKTFALLLLAVLAYAQNDETDPEEVIADCGINAEWTDCGSACPFTCKTRKDVDVACTDQCVRGCFCKQNYFRDYEGNCVDEIQCEVSDCPQNMTYANGVQNCAPTCNSKKDEECVVYLGGCKCETGYVLIPDGSCILEADCPQVKKCG